MPTRLRTPHARSDVEHQQQIDIGELQQVCRNTVTADPIHLCFAIIESITVDDPRVVQPPTAETE